jgi:hypothetical protein
MTVRQTATDAVFGLVPLIAGRAFVTGEESA